MEEFEPAETNLISTGDNSNDENDVDDETMSGNHEIPCVPCVIVTFKGNGDGHALYSQNTNSPTNEAAEKDGNSSLPATP